jgi:MFS family permease
MSAPIGSITTTAPKKLTFQQVPRRQISGHPWCALHHVRGGLDVGTVFLGVGRAMVYPSLIAVVSDVAAPEWRARSLSVYRFGRDLGYAVGALLSGVIADLLGIEWAIGVVGGLTLVSGIIAPSRMRETVHPIASPAIRHA